MATTKIGRCRIVKEIIEAVREKAGPHFPRTPYVRGGISDHCGESRSRG